jgi:hypothetical protein
MRTIAKQMELERSKHEEFWRVIAEFFDRPIPTAAMGSWTPWIDLTHVWVRGALLSYLVTHPLTSEFIEESIDGRCMHLTAQILYFHVQAHGLFGLEVRPNLHPKLDAKLTHRLVERAAEKFAQTILDKQWGWRLRSCVPLSIIKLGSKRHWGEVQIHLSYPEDQLLPTVLPCFSCGRVRRGWTGRRSSNCLM